MVARPGAPATPIPLRAPDRRAHNLPAQPAPLIGRDDAVATLHARLLDPVVRLLTLTGTAGTGKTRLALAAAEAVLDEYADQVWFVGLEAVREPDQVVATIAQALGVREVAGQSLATTLTAHLADRYLLLVLDNFEHVLAAGEQVAGLLAECPDLHVLVTSRAPLRLRWEHEFPVVPLALPEVTRGIDAAVEQSPAVQLFVARARAVVPEFRVTEANAATVAAICTRLDGLPLAIELAAARVRLLSLDAILERLTQRLNLLTNGPRDLPERHRTLRAAIAWSYDLLTSQEQSLFRRLAVFVGGCTVVAAEAVAGAVGDDGSSPPMADGLVLDLLDALLGQSLLRREQAESSAPRLRLLETVREFALERLTATGELTDTQLRHADYCLALVEAAEPHLTGAEQADWLSRLEVEHDNIRAALTWALAVGDAELALRLGVAMGRFWLVRGHLSEGRRWLEQALAAGGAPPARLRALAFHAAARLAWYQADFPVARAYAEASLLMWQELGDKREIAVSLNTLGTIAVRQADYATARGHFTEALTFVRALGDNWRIAVALYNLGTVATELGDYAAARSYFEESLSLRRGLGDGLGIASSLDSLGNLVNVLGDHVTARTLCEEGLALRRTLGDRQAIAYSLWNLALAARFQGECAVARECVEESLALRRALGDRHGMAWSLNLLAMVAQDQGDRTTAQFCWDESLRLSWELGSTLGVTNCLVGLARLATARAQPERAARLLGAATALREAIGYVIPPAERAEYEAGVAAVRVALGEKAFTTTWAAGRALSLDEVVAEALAPNDARGTRNDEAAGPRSGSSHIVPRASFPNRLTAREVEVLRLIAAGKSNLAIADALVITEGTVERHVSNLYAKIGARGRAEATAFAFRHALAQPADA